MIIVSAVPLIPENRKKDDSFNFNFERFVCLEIKNATENFWWKKNADDFHYFFFLF